MLLYCGKRDDNSQSIGAGRRIASQRIASRRIYIQVDSWKGYTIPHRQIAHLATMTRRIVRTVTISFITSHPILICNVQVRTTLQLASLTLLLLLLVFFLDTRYRVLPTSIHTHHPLHHPGLLVTDITIKTCSFSSCKLDPTIWTRVEKDLLLKTGWITKGYVHIQRKKEEELGEGERVVMDVKVGRLDPGRASSKDAEGGGGGGGGGEGEGVWEKRPAGLWIKRSSRRKDSESKNVVTAVDVLFGADAVDPRSGWSIRDQPLLLDYPKDAPEARITIRRGQPKKVEPPIPRVRKDGKFKIMQLADLHLSTGLGSCRDANPPGGPGGREGKCEADPRTLEFVTRLLDQEKPDFVVLSGDQVNGETAPDAQSVWHITLHPFPGIVLSWLLIVHVICTGHLQIRRHTRLPPHPLQRHLRQPRRRRVANPHANRLPPASQPRRLPPLLPHLLWPQHHPRRGQLLHTRPGAYRTPLRAYHVLPRFALLLSGREEIQGV